MQTEKQVKLFFSPNGGRTVFISRDTVYFYFFQKPLFTIKKM